MDGFVFKGLNIYYLTVKYFQIRSTADTRGAKLLTSVRNQSNSSQLTQHSADPGLRWVEE